MNVKELWAKRPFWINKYTITLFVFTIFITFADDNGLWERFKLMRQQQKVNADIEYYEEKISSTNQEISNLSKNDSTLERYAREQYLMHNEDEDVFLIEEPE